MSGDFGARMDRHSLTRVNAGECLFGVAQCDELAVDCLHAGQFDGDRGGVVISGFRNVFHPAVGHGTGADGHPVVDPYVGSYFEAQHFTDGGPIGIESLIQFTHHQGAGLQGDQIGTPGESMVDVIF